jgi:hypothetical protein
MTLLSEGDNRPRGNSDRAWTRIIPTGAQVGTSRLANNFVQVTLTALHELLGPSQNFSKEMIAGPNSRSEFGLRIARHVDLSAETFLDFPERRRELREADSANDEQVHVARRVLLAARDGSVNEGYVNLSVELLK